MPPPAPVRYLFPLSVKPSRRSPISSLPPWSPYRSGSPIDVMKDRRPRSLF